MHLPQHQPMFMLFAKQKSLPKPAQATPLMRASDFRHLIQFPRAAEEEDEVKNSINQMPKRKKFDRTFYEL